MFKRSEISTEVDRKPFVFTLVCLIVGLTVTIAAFLLGRGNGLAVFAGLMMAVVTLAAAIVLAAMVSDQAYIRDGILHISYLLKKAEIPLEKIGKVTLKDDIYSVYDRRGQLVGTINGLLTGIDSILYALDKTGIKIG